MPIRKGGASVDLQQQPISALKGVGPRVAEKLAARGLATLQDLWLQLPRQYEDRTAGTVFNAEGEPKGGDLETALQNSQ